MGTHTWMWFNKDEEVEETVTLPLLVGFSVVVFTVAILYLLSRRHSIVGRTGTTFARFEGGKQVRRSTRSRKGVSRWSPDDLGTPTGMSEDKTTSLIGSVTPTQLLKKAKLELPSSPLPLTPNGSKKPGRKSGGTPAVKGSIKASPPSPPRTRRSANTPAGKH